MLPGGDVKADPATYISVLEQMGTEEEDGDHEFSTKADYLFTREWSHITTVSQAVTFVRKLWDLTTPNERRYIYCVYHGISTAVDAISVLQDRADDLERMIQQLEAERAAEIARFRVDPDAVASTVLDDMIRYREDLERTKAQLESERGSIRPDSRHESNATTRVAVGAGPVMSRIRRRDGIEDNQDYRVYKLLSLADSLHDFSSHAQKAKDRMDRKVIDRAVKAQHMTIPKGDHAQETLELAANDASFIKFLNNNETLRFGKDDVRHNMFGIGMLDRCDVQRAMQANGGNYWMAYREQYVASKLKSGVAHLDVWSLPQFSVKQGVAKSWHDEPKNYKAVVYLSQIADVIAGIKRAYGKERITFIMDESDDQMSRMVMATSKLDVAIGRMLIVREGRSMDDDDWLLPPDEELPTDDAPEPRDKWDYMVCDANLVDGPTHIRPPDDQDMYPNPRMDPRPTGPVFRREDRIHISYEGIEEPEDPDAVIHINGSRQVLNHETAEFSKSNMRTAMKNGADVATCLAEKRSCDWGQVEHCRRYDTPDNTFVFVSRDKMACLYGVYRNVNVVFLRRGFACKNTRWTDTPTIFQNTFTLIKADLDGPDHQTGGSEPSSIAAYASAAIVLVAAVLG